MTTQTTKLKSASDEQLLRKLWEGVMTMPSKTQKEMSDRDFCKLAVTELEIRLKNAYSQGYEKGSCRGSGPDDLMG